MIYWLYLPIAWYDFLEIWKRKSKLSCFLGFHECFIEKLIFASAFITDYLKTKEGKKRCQYIQSGRQIRYIPDGKEPG